MKLIQRLVLCGLIAVVLSCLFGMTAKCGFAEQGQLVFEKNTRYDVYYALEDVMQCISNVKIGGTVTIGGATFLNIQCPGIATDNAGYIALPNVRAILPTGTPKPQSVN